MCIERSKHCIEDWRIGVKCVCRGTKLNSIRVSLVRVSNLKFTDLSVGGTCEVNDADCPGDIMIADRTRPELSPQLHIGVYMQQLIRRRAISGQYIDINKIGTRR